MSNIEASREPHSRRDRELANGTRLLSLSDERPLFLSYLPRAVSAASIAASSTTRIPISAALDQRAPTGAGASASNAAAGDEPGDLRDRKDEDEVKEQLERGDRSALESGPMPSATESTSAETE